jgi:hypothetical protein
LGYRSSADVDGEPDRGGYWHGIASYKEAEDEECDDAGVDDVEVDVDDDDDDDEEEEDPLSRELLHGRRFPDATIAGALLGALLPGKMPASWVATSGAMESIVGGAGGMGLLLRLSEAAEACGRSAGDDEDDTGGAPTSSSAPLLLLRSRSPATAATTRKSTTTTTATFADGLAETARAFVPVALEFGVVAVVAKCFE